jgi:Rrf2 family protein
MLQIRRESDYAVRVVVELAGHALGENVRTEDLARATGIPHPYLAKVIQALARAHLVQTRQGPGGGIRLVRDPKTVTLGQMVEAVEGPFRLNRCLVGPGECLRDSFCSVHPVWARLQAVLDRELAAVTASDLAAPRAAVGTRVGSADRRDGDGR